MSRSSFAGICGGLAWLLWNGAATAQAPLTPTSQLSGAGCFQIRCFPQMQSLDGDLAVTINTGPGVVVHVRDASQWSVQQVITNPDYPQPPSPFSPTQRFGPAAGSGDSLIVAGSSRIWNRKDVVYVFNRAGSMWHHIQNLVLPRPSGYDRTHVNQVRIGAVWAAVGGNRVKDESDPGSFEQIDLYRRNADGTFSRKASVRPPWDVSHPYFPMALDGNLLIVGEPWFTNGSAIDAGRVHVYEYDSARGWRKRWTLQPQAPTPGMAFGHSIDVDNGIIVVGAPGVTYPARPDYEGAVHVFERSGNTWVESRIEPVDAALGGYRIGEDVAVSGQRVLALKTLSAASFDLPEFGYVFEKHGSWIPAIELLRPAGEVLLQQGGNLSGSTAIVGASDFAYGRPMYVYDLPEPANQVDPPRAGSALPGT